MEFLLCFLQNERHHSAVVIFWVGTGILPWLQDSITRRYYYYNSMQSNCHFSSCSEPGKSEHTKKSYFFNCKIRQTSAVGGHQGGRPPSRRIRFMSSAHSRDLFHSFTFVKGRSVSRNGNCLFQQHFHVVTITRNVTVTSAGNVYWNTNIFELGLFCVVHLHMYTVIKTSNIHPAHKYRDVASHSEREKQQLTDPQHTNN